jgi:hypothetical protein
MAKIFGTIQSLKSLKSELKNQGISRFNSVKEIKAFLSNYDLEQLTILNDTSKGLKTEFSETCVNLEQKKQKRTEVINFETEKLNNQILDLKKKINRKLNLSL